MRGLTATLRLAAAFALAACLTRAASADLLFVADYNGNDVLRYDTATGKGTQIASGGALVHPSAIALAPDGSTLYVIGRDNEIVTRLNPLTGTVLGTFNVSGLSVASGLTVAPDGHSLYISGDGSNNVLRVDSATGATLGNFAAPGGPQKTAISSDGTTLYVATISGGSSTGEVLRLDAATGASLGTPFTSAFFYNPTGVALTPDGSALYVANETNNKVVRLNTADGSVSATYNAAGSPVDIVLGSGGSTLYVPSYASSFILAVDAGTGTATTFASGAPLNGPISLALLPIPAVPEPSSWVLLTVAGAFVGAASTRRSRAS